MHLPYPSLVRNVRLGACVPSLRASAKVADEYVTDAAECLLGWWQEWPDWEDETRIGAGRAPGLKDGDLHRITRPSNWIGTDLYSDMEPHLVGPHGWPECWGILCIRARCRSHGTPQELAMGRKQRGSGEQG